MRSKISIKKKTAATLTAGVIVVGGAAGAYAYWTSSGSGSGTATTDSSNTSLTVNQVSVPTNMAPGVSPGAISFSVTNNSTTQKARVSNVTVAISSVDGGTKNTGTPCTIADYDLTQPNWTPVELAASATSSANATATLGFHNTTANQDNCRGAVVHLTYTAS